MKEYIYTWQQTYQSYLSHLNCVKHPIAIFAVLCSTRMFCFVAIGSKWQCKVLKDFVMDLYASLNVSQ